MAILRAALALALASACTPTIADGAFHCGPDEACPPGQACDGATVTCVAPTQARAFACDPADLHEPDDTPAQAFDAGTVDCVSSYVPLAGCLAAGDTANWLELGTGAACGASIAIGVSYPLAFEAIELQVVDGSGATVAAGSACDSDLAGETATCAVVPITSGSAYFIGLSGAAPNCDGACDFTSYTFDAAGSL